MEFKLEITPQIPVDEMFPLEATLADLGYEVTEGGVHVTESSCCIFFGTRKDNALREEKTEV